MEAVLQALVNGLLAGSLIAVPAVGFTAIFAILRYPSFAIAGYVSVGGFAGWWVNTAMGQGAVWGRCAG
jgi:branched-chain amino acid transport system permease protein